MTKTPVIAFENVSFGYDSGLILDDVSLAISPRDVALITGPNGGGKTTLLRLLLGLLKPQQGHIIYRNDDGEQLKRLRIGYLPQKSAVDSRFPITVRSVVDSALLSGKHSDARALVNGALATVGMQQYADRPLGDLSGGQVQRVLLARAIVSNPDLLVLDEPLSYLDEENRARVYDIVKRLSATTTIVIVSHELSEFDPIATIRFYVNSTVKHLQ